MVETLVYILFWISLLGVVYSYLLYPLILRLYINKDYDSCRGETENAYPDLSLIITVHNEASRIRKKLENTLALNYPGNKEILIASDASTDATNDIVKEYSGFGVRLIEVIEHKGKENAQLHAIKEARGEIMVFSDAATEIEADGLIKLVSYFYDNKVGAASSEDRFVSNDGNVVGEGAYVKYEMWLRRCESKAAGLVGLSGSFFAARKTVCDMWDVYSPSDFNTALSCAKKGMIAVTMPDVHGYYRDLADPAKEYQRKIRTIIRGLTAIARHKEVLNPFRFGWFAFQIWSHKIMRWVVPWFMLLLLLASYLLSAEGGVYTLVFYAQLLFYGSVLIAHFIVPLRENAFFKLPYFFVQVNLALAHAMLQFALGKRMYTWVPSER